MNNAFLLIFYLFYYLFATAYGAYAYVGVGLGGMRMARKVGMNNPWMFWVPMANVYALGNLADTQAALCEGKSTTYRKKMLAWTIVNICSAIFMVISMVPFMVAATANGMLDEYGNLTTLDSAGEEALIGPALFFLFGLLVFFVLYIIYLVVYYKSLYRIFKLYAPDGAAGLLVLAVLVSIAIPAVFLALSKREPALPIPAESDGDTPDGGTEFYSL